ncbi:hypothetical protein GP475_00240 [Corynebacterium poyangense]|uniref:Uncharacterized protein n=1 Tax=Corynebacterium poyangense TaxID=2684405 RepID=A0A7H0SL04_9CORY|nr:hypothetical protein [Corynebacterium poyangense]MBZ8177315.1 hypothetical protein [Corynebacterium poyangense]QNQ89229.1 hypothetical protein GP475_00240 [Corynebacterium poyangense]
MSSPEVRAVIGKLGVWAQVNHPVTTANLMRRLTSSKSHKHHSHQNISVEERRTGLDVAAKAAGIPQQVPPEDRLNGIALANRAARIPGTI